MYDNTEIHFPFDKDKFLTVMQILCQETKDLDVLKAVKLLYLIDREHIRAYGHPLLGDHYGAWEHGPVPLASYSILNSVRMGIIRNLPITIDENIQAKYPQFITKEDPDLQFLSKTELSTIQKIIAEHGMKTGWALRELSHKHATWIESQDPFSQKNPIDYRLFFKEDYDKCKDAYEAMMLEQKDRDFAEGFQVIEFPKEDKVKAFRALFNHGALFHCEEHGYSDHTSSNKYLLVMRGWAVDGKCFYYLPTSQVDKYRDNPIYNNSLFVFPVGSVDYFKDETAIVITNVHSGNFQKFENRYVNEAVNRKLVHLGNLESGNMSQICALVSSSDGLSNYEKRQLIPK